MTESVVIEPLSAEEADAFAVLVAERNRWESIWSEPPQVMAFWLLDVAKLCHLSPDDAARIVRGLVAKDKMFFEAPVSGLAEQVDPDEPPRFSRRRICLPCNDLKAVSVEQQRAEIGKPIPHKRSVVDGQMLSTEGEPMPDYVGSL